MSSLGLKLLATLAGLATLPMAPVHAAGVSGQGTWETTLLARDLDPNYDGPEAYYDTALNITWFINAGAYFANYHYTNQWAAGLNVNGITGWRLPKMVDFNNPPWTIGGCDFDFVGSDCGYNVSTEQAELAHMYFVTLGNKSSTGIDGNPQAGSGLLNTGPFRNVNKDWYWYSTPAQNMLVPEHAFVFMMEHRAELLDGGIETTSGRQSAVGMGNGAYAWAVHDGDVLAAVPEPSTFALTLLGTLGLAAWAARRKARAIGQAELATA